MSIILCSVCGKGIEHFVSEKEWWHKCITPENPGGKYVGEGFTPETAPKIDWLNDKFYEELGKALLRLSEEHSIYHNLMIKCLT